MPPPPPREGGLSTGGKLFLGCLALVVVGGVLAVLTLGAGAVFVGKAARDVVSEVRGDSGAGEELRELEERHPFQPPADGVVREEHVRRLEQAVEAVWVRLEPARDALEADRPGSTPPAGVREALEQFQGGMQGLERMREALADGLAEAGVSLQEFLWTSGRLVGAWRSLGMDSAPEGMPEENRELARRHAALAENLAGNPRNPEADRSAVLTVAMGAGGILALEELWTR